jgi:hypothetical protein
MMIPWRFGNRWHRKCKKFLKRWHLSVGREQSQGAEDNMKRDRMMLVATAMVAVFFLLTLGTPLVSANTITTITSTITFGNKALAGQTPPFGTVTVTVTGGKATVTFTALNSYLFGAVNAVDLNLTKAGITAKNFTWTGGNGKTAFFSAGSGNVSGFGRFNLTIDAFDGFKSAVKSVTFTLSGMWANASSVLKINKKGYDAAAHIFANGGKISGFAAEKPSAAVPDGGVTLMLLGGALVGIETLRRRLRV